MTTSDNANNTALRERLKAAYEKTSADIQALQTEAKEITNAVLQEVEELTKQVAALESKITILQDSIPAKTAVIQTLIDAEQAKVNFLTAKAKELQAAESGPAKK